MYAYPFVQMTRYKKKYYCVSATESTKEAIRGIIFFASFDFRSSWRKILSCCLSKLSGRRFAWNKSAGLTKYTTLCTTLVRLSREILVNRYRENLSLLIDDFYTHLHYSLLNNPVDFSHILCTSILGTKLSSDQKYLFIFCK